MNTRIEDLIQQANYKSIENWPDNFACQLCDRMDILAALIIQECMEINQQELAFNALTRVRERYEKHFGVDID